MIYSPGFNRINGFKTQQNNGYMNSSGSSNSLLAAAANTITFDTPNNSSFNTFNPVQSLPNNTNNNNNLDFDLQFCDFRNKGQNFKDPKLNEMILNMTNRPKKSSKNSDYPNIFKNDEDDDIEILNDKVTDNEEDDEFENHDNLSVSNGMFLSQRNNDLMGQKVGKILENPIRLMDNKTNQSKVVSMNMPIENQIKIDLANKIDNQNFNSVTNFTWFVLFHSLNNLFVKVPLLRTVFFSY